MLKITTGITQSQFGSGYPFIDPPSDIALLITDMTVCHESLDYQYPLGIRLAGLYHTDRDDVVLEDLEHNVIFDSRGYQFNNPWPEYTTYRTCLGQVFSAAEREANPIPCRQYTSTWGSFNVLYWETPFTVIKILLDSAMGRPTVIEPSSSTLDLRAVYFVPRRVRSINTFQGGDVALLDGYNVTLDAEDNSTDTTLSTKAEIISYPGAGQGSNTSATDCTECEVGGIFTINGVSPDSFGNITLDVAPGYHLSADCNGFTLSNSNTPCCSCADMGAFAEYVNQVTLSYMSIGGKGRYVRDAYKSLLETWEAKTYCRLYNPTVLIQSVYCPYINIYISFTNITPSCFDVLNLQFRVSTRVILDSLAPMDLESEETLELHSAITEPTDLLIFSAQKVDKGAKLVFHGIFKVPSLSAIPLDADGARVIGITLNQLNTEPYEDETYMNYGPWFQSNHRPHTLNYFHVGPSGLREELRVAGVTFTEILCDEDGLSTGTEDAVKRVQSLRKKPECEA